MVPREACRGVVENLPNLQFRNQNAALLKSMVKKATRQGVLFQLHNVPEVCK
jgi:hypothetical protein